MGIDLFLKLDVTNRTGINTMKRGPLHSFCIRRIHSRVEKDEATNQQRGSEGQESNEQGCLLHYIAESLSSNLVKSPYFKNTVEITGNLKQMLRLSLMSLG